jgi:starch synthase
VLGSGDKALETAPRCRPRIITANIGLVIGYDEPLSHLMQAGGDMMLVPSRFEPCGLTQLYGLRYGNVPVVAQHRRPGRHDHRCQRGSERRSKWQPAFSFRPVTPDALREALRRAIRAFSEPKVWAQLQNQGMKADVSWTRSQRVTCPSMPTLYAELLNAKSDA